MSLSDFIRTSSATFGTPPFKNCSPAGTAAADELPTRLDDSATARRRLDDRQFREILPSAGLTVRSQADIENRQFNAPKTAVFLPGLDAHARPCYARSALLNPI
jgi:hypothetical protein